MSWTSLLLINRLDLPVVPSLIDEATDEQGLILYGFDDVDVALGTAAATTVRRLHSQSWQEHW